MSCHLQKSHGLPLGNDKVDATQPTIMTMRKRKETVVISPSLVTYPSPCDVNHR
ncbi:hypothetical protein V1517DRAFT_334853 [Lipomyces orientalis]|uniref:Uncharacterized protein n=1 Tax=Lipomyces orientalis TaxID=1233043 RepID=A0ACC3TC16_9ASCO